jgi:hypothetical protein
MTTVTVRRIAVVQRVQHWECGSRLQSHNDYWSIYMKPSRESIVHRSFSVVTRASILEYILTGSIENEHIQHSSIHRHSEAKGK